jgi:hypothetical protein
MAAEPPAAAPHDVRAAEPPAAADATREPHGVKAAEPLIGTAALEALKDLPPGINGVALGCAAFANLLHALAPSPWDPAVLVAAAFSATLWLLFLASRLAAPHRILEEATKPRTFFPYGAWEMAFAFSFARLLPAHCAFGAYAAGFLQLIILIAFLKACWKDGAAPEPYWNPVCMSCAATTIVAAPCLGARHWLSMSSFGLALATCLVIAPPEAYAVLKDVKVSPHADVALLAAPCSISAAAFAAMKASREIVLWNSTWDDCVGGALAGLATLYAFFTIYAVRRRRATIRPFALVWATMTFPSAITCIVWLQYAPYVARRRRVWPLAYLARVVAVVDLVFIFAVVVGCGRLAVEELLRRRASSSEFSVV